MLNAMKSHIESATFLEVDCHTSSKQFETFNNVEYTIEHFDISEARINRLPT